MKKVIMGVGVPGSGKTTLLKTFWERNGRKSGYVYISPDEIRKKLYKDAPFDPAKNDEVWSLARDQVKNALFASKTVVFDSTFANVHQRREFISFSRACGAERIEGIFVDVPPEIAKERNRERGQRGEKMVPDDVIELMHNQLERNDPGTIDGFDAIFQIGSDGELLQTDLYREGRYLTRKFL